MELVKFIESMVEHTDFSNIDYSGPHNDKDDEEWELMKEKAIEMVKADGALAYELGDDDLDIIQRIGAL